MNNLKVSGIRIAREKRKLSISELANMLKVESSVIRNWEAGIGAIHLDTVLKISKLLSVPTEMILFGEERKPLNLSELDERQKEVVIRMYNIFKKK